MTVEIFEVKFKLEFSFFAVLTLMLLLSDTYTTVICFVCSMLHEAGHIFFMFAFSCKPDVIEFSAFGLAIKRKSDMLISYKRQFLIAMGGIIVNFILAVGSIAVYSFTANNLFFIIFFINLFIALLNMLPVEVLDMGRALNSLLMMKYDEVKTEKLLSLISDITVLAFTVFCILFFYFISVNISLCAVCIYLILINRKRRQTDVKQRN